MQITLAPTAGPLEISKDEETRCMIGRRLDWVYRVVISLNRRDNNGYYEMGYDQVADFVKETWVVIQRQHKIPRFPAVFKAALKNGAHLYPVITLDDEGNWRSGRDQLNIDLLTIRVYRKCYPACTSGRHRSQQFYDHASKHLRPDQLANAHGILKGEDYYFIPERDFTKDKDNALTVLREGDIVSIERSKRFGEGESNCDFEKEYWGEMIEQGATLVVLGHSIHGALYRLNGIARKLGKNLSLVHIVPILVSDPYKQEEKREEKIEQFVRAIDRIRFNVISG